MNNLDENFFVSGENKKNTIDSFLNGDEKILWKGRPKKMAYVLGKTLSIMPIGIIWAIIDFSILFFIFSNRVPIQVLFFIIPFFALHLMPFWIWVYNTVKAAKETKTVIYVITNQRILIFKGEKIFIDTALLLDDITDAKLKVNLIDKMLKVGDITVFAGEHQAQISDIPNSEFLHSKILELCKRNSESREEFYSQKVECLHCGTFYDKNEFRCPSCGAPNKKK